MILLPTRCQSGPYEPEAKEARFKQSSDVSAFTSVVSIRDTGIEVADQPEKGRQRGWKQTRIEVRDK